MAQEEQLDPLEQAWMVMAVAYERLKMERKISKLWEKHAVDSLGVIFQRGRIRAKHDPYYSALRNIIRDLTITAEEVTTESIRKKFESLLTSTLLDPGRLMDVAEEFGIVPTNPENWKRYVEEWRMMDRERKKAEEEILSRMSRVSAEEVANNEDKKAAEALKKVEEGVRRKHARKGTRQGKRKRS